MYCKECGSFCERIETRSTLRGTFIEEDINGCYHHHDENHVLETWKCKNGHTFYCEGENHCWCGWSSKNPDKIYHTPIPPIKESSRFIYQPPHETNDLT